MAGRQAGTAARFNYLKTAAAAENINVVRIPHIHSLRAVTRINNEMTTHEGFKHENCKRGKGSDASLAHAGLQTKQ